MRGGGSTNNKRGGGRKGKKPKTYETTLTLGRRMRVHTHGGGARMGRDGRLSLLLLFYQNGGHACRANWGHDAYTHAGRGHNLGESYARDLSFLVCLVCLLLPPSGTCLVIRGIRSVERQGWPARTRLKPEKQRKDSSLCPRVTRL